MEAQLTRTPTFHTQGVKLTAGEVNAIIENIPALDIEDIITKYCGLQSRNPGKTSKGQLRSMHSGRTNSAQVPALDVVIPQVAGRVACLSGVNLSHWLRVADLVACQSGVNLSHWLRVAGQSSSMPEWCMLVQENPSITTTLGPEGV